MIYPWSKQFFGFFRGAWCLYPLNFAAGGYHGFIPVSAE